MITLAGYRPIEVGDECEECGGRVGIVTSWACACHIGQTCRHCDGVTPQCLVCGSKLKLLKVAP